MTRAMCGKTDAQSDSIHGGFSLCLESKDRFSCAHPNYRSGCSGGPGRLASLFHKECPQFAPRPEPRLMR